MHRIEFDCDGRTIAVTHYREVLGDPIDEVRYEAKRLAKIHGAPVVARNADGLILVVVAGPDLVYAV